MVAPPPIFKKIIFRKTIDFLTLAFQRLTGLMYRITNLRESFCINKKSKIMTKRPIITMNYKITEYNTWRQIHLPSRYLHILQHEIFKKIMHCRVYVLITFCLEWQAKKSKFKKKWRGITARLTDLLDFWF